MTNFRFFSLTVALAAISALTACNTAPAMPTGTMAASGMATPEHMAKMDAQMKTMGDMHQKMMATKTPQERANLMADHMKAMKDGMAMMGDKSSGGMADMKGMQGMTGEMGKHHQMMGKRMEMMDMMMRMMGDQMSAMPVR